MSKLASLRIKNTIVWRKKNAFFNFCNISFFALIERGIANYVIYMLDLGWWGWIFRNVCMHLNPNQSCIITEFPIPFLSVYIFVREVPVTICLPSGAFFMPFCFESAIVLMEKWQIIICQREYNVADRQTAGLFQSSVPAMGPPAPRNLSSPRRE
jgi:hypothetical protein